MDPVMLAIEKGGPWALLCYVVWWATVKVVPQFEGMRADIQHLTQVMTAHFGVLAQPDSTETARRPANDTAKVGI